MTGSIEAIHIYDERNNPILSHTYTSRSLSPTHLLPLYLEHPAPRPSLILLSNTNPPSLVFSLSHDNLLLLLTTSREVEPLLILEFLHRLVDILEEFLGAPLISHKIENSYDTVAQLLTEICDAGIVANTEPNALRDNVEVEGWVGKLLGNITLPNQVKDLGIATLARTATPVSFGNGIGSGQSSLSSLSSSSFGQSGAPTTALPWRRANVRHTSNEMYADVIESLNVTLAPSGRPLSAFANGTIAFNSKVSGVPDITVTMSGPSGRHNLASVIELPVFHPCVRLARWKQQPGVLSFVPPDGRFTLAGYEVDLLPFISGNSTNLHNNTLKLPVNLDMKTSLGPTGTDFEVRVYINKLLGMSSGVHGGTTMGRASLPTGRGHAGTPSSPLLESIVVDVPLPKDVRNLVEIRPSKGDANYNASEKRLTWHIPAKDLASGSTFFYLKSSVVGGSSIAVEDDLAPHSAYDTAYQAEVRTIELDQTPRSGVADSNRIDRDSRRSAQNRTLMPSSASVSFSVKGWLASGIKIDSMLLDARQSKGLGENIKPYKGVKYLTVSKQGMELRC